MTNIWGELVPDNLRAEALAEYFEQVQWKINDTEEYSANKSQLTKNPFLNNAQR